MAKVDCSEMSKVIAQIALNLGSRPEIKNLDGVLAKMQEDLGEGFTRQELVGAIVDAHSSGERASTELGKKLEALKQEARNDTALRHRITQLEKHLAEGTKPAAQPPRPDAPEPIAQFREKRDALMKQLRNSEPVLREKYEKQIAELTKRIEEAPIPRPKKEPPAMASKELERMIFERDQLRRQINQRINELKPKSVWSHIAEPFNAARAIMTSFDFSAVLRQGGFVALGHPVRAAKALGPMFRAFGSEFQANKIHQEIQARDNAPLYKRTKLYLAEQDGPVSVQEEAFMSRWAGKIPGVKGSQRAYTTFLNKLRADSFDTMLSTLAKNGEATLDEAKAVANFINVATGRGALGAKIEPAAEMLNAVFFAPRYVTSRFQLLFGQPFKGGSGRTKALIAQEYGRYLIGLGTVLALGAAAGGELEHDPRSSDFGKIRFGRTRLDPMSGMASVATLIGRLTSGQTKDENDRVKDLRGPRAKYGTSVFETAGRFVRTKFSPAVSAPVNVLDGKNVIDEPATVKSEAINLAIPLSFRDIAKTMEEQGVPKGVAFSLLNLFGMSLQTHADRKKKG